MRSLCIIFCLSISFGILAEPKYPVSEIPDDLKKDMNAVVREDHMTFRIDSRSSATFKCHYVVTIFNSKARDLAYRSVWYTKLRKVSSLKASVYDQSGGLIKKLKNSEIVDHGLYDGSLYSDTRTKSIDLTQTSYPYTVDFEYEIDYNFLYFIDGTELGAREKVSVQNASYELIYPTQLKPQYKVLNTDQKPSQQSLPGGFESLSWSFKNIMPIKFEPMGPPRDLQTLRIEAAPSEFEYEGYVGNMDTWTDYGKWHTLLNNGRDVLPAATRQKVQQLIKGLQTTEEKAKVLYEYMQGRTRYVSIQLGIGGLQPFDARIVDETGYGDCKALSNYMVALLKEAGIKGYYATVMSGEDAPEVMLDFPSHQFDHVIVAVPDKSDTIWLECTSQTVPFGYMGTFTGDRKAMIVTEDGGKMVNTPRYKSKVNTISRSADVVIDKTGSARAKVSTTYSGLQYEHNNLDTYLRMSRNDQQKWLETDIGISSFDIAGFTMTNRKARSPYAVVEVDLVLNHFTSVSGKRLFLTPNLMNRSTFVPEKVEQRKSDVIRRMNYTDIDTIQYRVPEDMYPEFLPKPVQLKSRFGEYDASIVIEQGKIIYSRKLNIKKGEFPPESYSELVEFFKDITKADNIKIVLLSKT